MPWLTVPHAVPHQTRSSPPFPPVVSGLGQTPAASGSSGAEILGGVTGIVSAILGPVAQAGSSIYATREQGKIAKRELQQRGVEFAQLQELQKLQLEAQERQHRLAQQAAIQQSQLRIAAVQRTAPYVVGGAALVVGGVLMVMLLRGGK